MAIRGVGDWGAGVDAVGVTDGVGRVTVGEGEGGGVGLGVAVGTGVGVGGGVGVGVGVAAGVGVGEITGDGVGLGDGVEGAGDFASTSPMRSTASCGTKSSPR